MAQSQGSLDHTFITIVHVNCIEYFVLAAGLPSKMSQLQDSRIATEAVSLPFISLGKIILLGLLKLSLD